MKELPALRQADNHAQRINEIVAAGKRLLERDLPALAPRAPTIAVISRDSQGDGDYVACLRGAFYFRFHPVTLDLPKADAVTTSAHEQVHQRHAEIMGPRVYERFDYDAVISDEEIARLSPQRLIRLLEARTRKVQIGNKLTESLTEGLSIWAELKIIETHLEDALAWGHVERARSFQNLRNTVISTNRLTRGRKSKAVRAHYEGMVMFEKLGRELDTDAIIELVHGIDYEAANQIPMGSPDYKRILRNPFLVPMVA